MIPRIIHQTWSTQDLPKRFAGNAESWRSKHPGWEYRLWTDNDLDAFVRSHWPSIYRGWRRYPDTIQRVDAARYMILHTMGGLYADLDIECLRAFDSLLRERIVLAPTRPLGVSNDLMLAEPSHPLFDRAVRWLDPTRRILRPGLLPRHVRVLMSTGSLYLTMVYRSRPAGVTFLDGGRYDSDDPERAWVRHHPGNTWAGSDTRILTKLYYESWPRWRARLQGATSRNRGRNQT